MTELIHQLDFRPFFIKNRNRISSSEAKIYADLYKKGCSLKDIALKFSCSKNKIRAQLMRQGLKLRGLQTQATYRRSIKSGKQAALPFYGFCYFEGQIVKDQREFPTLQVIHRQWNQGKTIHQITLQLNQAKILSRRGKRWSWVAVQNIVSRFENKTVTL